jgi:hypothetical protein
MEARVGVLRRGGHIRADRLREMRAWIIGALALLSATPTLAQSNVELSHRLGSGEIRTGDGRLVDTLSKPELVCLFYLMWWYESQNACTSTELKTMQGSCGEDLKPKADACQLTH